MKNPSKILVVLSAIITVVAIYSRLTLTPIYGIESRAMVGFAGLLLLFAIAIKDKK
ncbi:MAG: hypothetical protein AB1481_04085 [Candidatus Omnitrophota bacterium]